MNKEFKPGWFLISIFVFLIIAFLWIFVRPIMVRSYCYKSNLLDFNGRRECLLRNGFTNKESFQ